jgi:uncharacterized protein (TIGR02466 family)
MNFVDLFSAPIQIADMELNIPSLITFCYEMQQKNEKGVSISNLGGWQSDCILNETHPEFVKLKDKIEETANIYHNEIGFKKHLKEVIGNIWININGKGHSNELHQHHYSIFSGSYYLRTCNAPIAFRHPFKDINTYWWNTEIIEEYNQATSGIWTILPAANSIILFPAWLEHKVLANNEDSDRITISFNTTLEKENG